MRAENKNVGRYENDIIDHRQLSLPFVKNLHYEYKLRFNKSTKYAMSACKSLGTLLVLLLLLLLVVLGEVRVLFSQHDQQERQREQAGPTYKNTYCPESQYLWQRNLGIVFDTL